MQLVDYLNIFDKARQHLATQNNLKSMDQLLTYQISLDYFKKDVAMTDAFLLSSYQYGFTIHKLHEIKKTLNI